MKYCLIMLFLLLATALDTTQIRRLGLRINESRVGRSQPTNWSGQKQAPSFCRYRLFSSLPKGFRMGSAPSGSNAIATLPTGIEELNDHVFQLHPLHKGGSRDIPEVEIIFFHGLQLGDFEHAYWKTWLSRDGSSELWPQKWLSEEFPNARILSISYDASARALEGNLNEYVLGENLVKNIVMDPINIGQNCPVVLVGHSLGGIVIKQFVLSCDKEGSWGTDESVKIQTFLKNVKGVFYYATPHQGTREVTLAKLIEGNNPILELLRTLNATRARINEGMGQIRAKLDAKTYGMAESIPTHYEPRRFNAMVVEEASARHDVDSYYTAEKSNHFDVCRPPSRRSGIFRNLTQFITSTTRVNSSVAA